MTNGQVANPDLISGVSRFGDFGKLKPQLAEGGSLDDLIRYCEDEHWVMTPKADGHRKLVLVDQGVIRPLNRAGEATTLPEPMLQQFGRLKGRWAFDCELLTDVLAVFDLPVAGDRINTQSPYHHRRRVLEGIFPAWQPGSAIRLLPAAWDQTSKATMAKTVITQGGEGMIVNHVDGIYRPGPRRNPQILKLKLVKDVDAEVVELHREGKNNMVLAVYDADGKQIEIGECTAMNGDGPKIKVGDVVTVRYLYWSGTRLVQPTTPRIRTSKQPSQCLLDQLVIGNTRGLPDLDLGGVS